MGDAYITRRNSAQEIEKIYADISPDGYICATPQSLCGKKIKELTLHIMSKSPEISAVAFHNRRLNHILSRQTIDVMYFILDTFSPIIISAVLAYILYTVQQTPTTIEISQTQPINNMTYKEILDTTVTSAGTFLGSIVWYTGLLTTTTIDTATGITATIDKTTKGVISLICGFISYIVLEQLTRVWKIKRQSAEKKDSLEIIQTEFIKEYERAIERAMITLVRPPVLKLLENNASNYHSALNRIDEYVRMMPIPNILHIGQASPYFHQLLFKMIRESGEDTAAHLEQFTKTLMDAPVNMRDAVIAPIQNTVDLTMSLTK